MRFPVVLHSDDGVRFGVTVPDLPGCFSSGDTFDAALEVTVTLYHLHSLSRPVRSRHGKTSQNHRARCFASCDSAGQPASEMVGHHANHSQ
ncbi:hypothetical protein D5085_03965 [Ectothiorhodospiraceae bacterium BW-2]|nr:hypothetical protein D5085_03965 [Ectothiorhodospiraceae bacterium BW-2]